MTWLAETWRPTGSVNVDEIGAYLSTSIGLVRPENQDRCLIVRSATQGFLCCIVCDGIGGLTSGAHAAEIAIAAFAAGLVECPECDDKARLVYAADAANRLVYQAYSESGGTTLAALLFGRSPRPIGLTAGDSRIYSVSSQSGLRQISDDDTIAGELRRLKGGSVGITSTDPSQRHLAQYVGMGKGFAPRIYDDIPVDRTITMVITTDGVHSTPEKTFEQIATNARTPTTLGMRLQQISEWLGGSDNASLIALPSVKSSMKQPSSERLRSSLEIWTPFAKLQLLGGLKFGEHDELVPKIPTRGLGARNAKRTGGFGSSADAEPRRRIVPRRKVPSEIGIELVQDSGDDKSQREVAENVDEVGGSVD